MKVLIIGATSSLGTSLVTFFSEFSHVYTAGRKNCDIKIDLSSINKPTAIPKNLDAVINTAAHFGGIDFKDYMESLNVNVMGLLSLLGVCKKADTKQFIQVSSTSSLLGTNSDYYGIYSITKKHADEIASQFCLAHSLPLTIIRPSQIYGDDDSFRKHQPFLYAAADCAERGEDIMIYGTNDAKRNHIHVDDLTAILSKIVQEKILGVFTCTHPTDVTFSEIAKAAYSAFNKRGNVRFLQDKSDVQDNVFPYDSSLFEKINYYPSVSIEDGLKRISMYREGIKK